jgi:dynein heavy chain
LSNILSQEIEKLLALVKEIEVSPNIVRFSMLYLEVDALQTELVDRAKGLVLRLADQVADINRRQNSR